VKRAPPPLSSLARSTSCFAITHAHTITLTHTLTHSLSLSLSLNHIFSHFLAARTLLPPSRVLFFFSRCSPFSALHFEYKYRWMYYTYTRNAHCLDKKSRGTAPKPQHHQSASQDFVDSRGLSPGYSYSYTQLCHGTKNATKVRSKSIAPLRHCSRRLSARRAVQKTEVAANKFMDYGHQVVRLANVLIWHFLYHYYCRANCGLLAITFSSLSHYF
jgi:hypothetical protein